MRYRWKLASRPAVFVVVALGGFAVSVAAKDFVKPAAQPAKTYPAHDEHPSEKVAIAADPYDTPEKTKIFSVDFREHGYLPVFFVVTNDGDQPISIANLEVKLITANRSKLTPASPEDIYRRLSNPRANTNSPVPFPIPRKKVKGTVSKKEMDEIESSEFAARAVEPHATQSGFLYFDVGGISEPLAGAHIDVTRITDAKGNELMYFEIPIEKYLSAPKKTN
ncbi:MAG: hypothetical protein DMG77_13435 [Acidobacteria bacterium]|nr:MAG: hypothetical protein DMG77_13435 [Acidobacteriota bacterium]